MNQPFPFFQGLLRKRQKLRSSCAIILALSTTFALSSCVSKSEDIPDDYISIFHSEPQHGLIPTNTNENGGGEVVDNLFRGLVDYDSEGKPINMVAESITPNENSTQFTIKLKDNWTFSNGEKVTARSFIDAWNFAANPKNAQLQAAMFSNIKGYEELTAPNSTMTTLSGLTELSPYEFRVELTVPEAVFPIKLGHASFYPLPQVAYEDIDSFGENPIGNGPYQMVDRGWIHNVQILLKKNPSYAGPDKPINEGLAFKIYSSMDTAYADLQSGDLDTIRDQIPQNTYPAYEADFPDTHYSIPQPAIQNFTVPSTLPQFEPGEEGNLRRRAISMSINRDLIVEKIYFSNREVARNFTSPIIEKESTPLKGVEVLDYNPDQARTLWKQANAIRPWGGQAFEIAYNSDGGHGPWVEAVTNSIRQTLNIDAKGKAYPTFKSLRNDVVNRTINAAFRSGWIAEYPSPESFLKENYVTDAPSNDGDYSNPEVDKLIATAAAQSNREDSNAYYHQAQEILIQDLPQIPLWYYSSTVAYSPQLSAHPTNWRSFPDYTQLVKKKESES